MSPRCVCPSRYVQPVTYAVPVAMDGGGSNSGYETMQSREGAPVLMPPPVLGVAGHQPCRQRQRHLSTHPCLLRNYVSYNRVPALLVPGY